MQRDATQDTSLEDVRALFEVNYLGCTAMVRAFAPAMIAARRGTIVNVGCARVRALERGRARLLRGAAAD